MPRLPQRNDNQPADADPDFSSTFPARTDALVDSRHDFTVWLHRSRADDETRAEMAVVFSELGANAVDGSPRPSSEVRARAWWETDDVVLQISNETAETSSRWDLDDPLREGGRGLVIVQAFVDEIDVRRDGDADLVVRCRRCVSDQA